MKNYLLDIEELSSRFHKVYQRELRRQGKKSKYSDFWYMLPEDIKDIDRALAKYVIEFVIPQCQPVFEKKSVKELLPVMGEAYKDLSVQVAFKEGYNRAIKEMRR